VIWVIVIKLIKTTVPEGRDVIEFLEDEIKRLGLRSGTITGIGGLEEAVIGVYDGEKYHEIKISPRQPFIIEVGSLLGNYGYVGNRLRIHIHVVLATYTGEGYRVYAGHLIRSRVKPFVELGIYEQ